MASTLDPIEPGQDWSIVMKVGANGPSDPSVPMPLSAARLDVRKEQDRSGAILARLDTDGSDYGTAVIGGNDNDTVTFTLSGDASKDWTADYAYFDVWVVPVSGSKFYACDPQRIPLVKHVTERIGD